MNYEDKIAVLAAILLAARIQRGASGTDTNEIRTAIKTARALCGEITKENV